MKKASLIQTCVILLFLLAAVFARPSWGNETLTREEKEYLSDKKEIIFVSQTLYPPFEFVDKSGEHTGMAIELARWIAVEFGFQARFTDASFHDAQDAILTGKADALTSFFYSKKRDQLFDFTSVIFEVPASIFVKADRPDIRGIEDLNGKTVAIQKGDYALDFLRERNIAFTPLLTENFAEAADRVIEGKADAVVGDEQIVLYHLYTGGLADRLKKTGEALYPGHDCMAVKEGNALLLSILDKGVKNARTSGVLEKIERKWLGIPLAGESLLVKYRFHLVAFFALFAFLLAGLVLIWVWNIQLRRKVAARTEELSRSEKEIRAILDTSPIGIVHAKNRKIQWANETWRRMFGFDRNDEFAGKDTAILYATDEEYRRIGQLNENLEYQNIVAADVTHKRRDGSTFQGYMTMGRLLSSDPSSGVIITETDISARKKTEDALRESEKRYQELFTSIADTIYTQDLEGRFLSVNPAITKFFGYEEGELIGRKTSDFMKPVFRSEFGPGYLAKVTEEGAAEGVTCYLAKDGRQLYMEYHSVLVRPENGAPYISGVGRDVTDRIRAEREIKKLQEQVLHVRKMEAIGALAGGVAHNFNNLLMGIEGNLSLILLHTDASHPDYQRLKHIEQHVRDAAGLAKELLGFARGGKYELRPADINELIRKGSGMFGRTRKEIALHLNLQDNLWAVEIDAGQIEQALLNIYINSGQAMPSGGDISIQTGNIVIDEPTPHGLPCGRYVRVVIADTGTGMDEATVERIFDPFFTTKGASGGTGLGLASTYGIIRNHGGAIDVVSKPGKGTTFTIYLPATDAPVEDSPPEENNLSDRPGETTILLVDDEEMIREVGGEMLEALDCRVLYAKSGPEAIETYRQHGDAIDMVILDMIMPGMGGKETFAGLKRINPAVRALLASGYSIDGEAQAILDDGCRGFIQKPFSLAELSKKIAETLQ